MFRFKLIEPIYCISGCSVKVFITTRVGSEWASVNNVGYGLAIGTAIKF